MGIRDVVDAAVVKADELDDQLALGEKVKVRRQLNAGELMLIASAPAERKAAVRVSVCLYDEDGKPLFASPDEAGAIDWRTFEPLFDLTKNVKGLETENAAKK